MTDIIDRLRDRAYSTYRKDPLCEEAADEIANLRLELRVLRAAMVKAQEELSLADVVMETKPCLDNCCNRCDNVKKQIVNNILKWDKS
jgi:hypothetical protein